MILCTFFIKSLYYFREDLQNTTQIPGELSVIDELDSFLRELPLSPVDFSSISIVQPSSLKGNGSTNYFMQSTKEECKALYLNSSVGSISLARYSSNEYSFHGFWDDIEIFVNFVEGLSSMSIDHK